MKFQMAKNSLFAILLRSPWWISAAAAAGIFAAARLVLPEIHAFFVALPFAVIAAYAGWRQRHAPSAARVAGTLQALRAMSWDEFSSAIEDAYAREGYVVSRTLGAGADFELTRALVDAARARGVKVGIGPVASVDVFYNPDADYVTKWRSRGILAFEMEAAALFYLAARAQGSGEDVRAGCILTVSDTLGEQDTGDVETSEETYMELADLEAATVRMIEIALEAGTAEAGAARK